MVFNCKLCPFPHKTFYSNKICVTSAAVPKTIVNICYSLHVYEFVVSNPNTSQTLYYPIQFCTIYILNFFFY